MHDSPSVQTDGSRPGFPLSSWMFPLLVVIFVTFVEILGEPARLALRFDRAGLEAGEWWRVASGHFVHLGWRHVLLNAAGIVLVWLLVGRAFGAQRWLGSALAIAAGTSAGLWWLTPGVQWYVGLSGVLHGLLVAGLLGQLRIATIESSLLLGAVGLKLAIEQWWGPLPGSESATGGPVVTEAHLFGAVCGALVSLPVLIRDFRKAAI